MLNLVHKLSKHMLCYSDGIGKAIRLTHVLAASFAGLIAAAAASHYRKQVSTVVTDEKIIPQVDRTESGLSEKREKFSHYVGMLHFGEKSSSFNKINEDAI